ncbi:HDIG domain-containing protein, partial [bacterium]|nr:HDIG domain-containing protein [bacterium]
MSAIQITERAAEIIQKETNQSLAAGDLAYLVKQRFSKALQEDFQVIAKPLAGRLIAQTDLFASYYSTGIVLRQIGLGLNETVINDVSRIWSLDHARQLVTHTLESSPRRKNPGARRVAAMVGYLIIPNLKYNADLTEKRQRQNNVRKEFTRLTIKRGQVLLRKGEKVTEAQAEVVESLRKLTSIPALLQRFLWTALLMQVFFLSLFRFDLTRKSFLRLTLKNSLMFAAIAWLSITSMKLTLPFLQSFLAGMGIEQGAEFLLPVAAGGILVQLLMGRELAYTFAILMSVLGGHLADRSLFFGVWVFVVSMVAVQRLGACKQRTDLYRSGAWSGAIGALFVIASDTQLALGHQSLEWWTTMLHAIGAFGGAMVGAVIASTLIPILESGLGYTTNLKLLELSNFNHPLLHNLMMKAPGTYHHSIMVGSLAEIAADRIKANALLARVSAYYHDIGKMANPLYFIENQSPQYNPHDHLSPAISARILFSHVKNGARMGREHNLGESINDIIQQHHGTTLATFFFNKAKEQHTGDAPVTEAEFRYPGPRPQTREAAIVMIADACEASTRSIAEPTPLKIQGMVHDIINKRFLDQQFHDCELTLKDLQIIEESISRTLLSLYHHRIEYPGQKQALTEATAEMARKNL